MFSSLLSPFRCHPRSNPNLPCSLFPVCSIYNAFSFCSLFLSCTFSSVNLSFVPYFYSSCFLFFVLSPSLYYSFCIRCALSISLPCSRSYVLRIYESLFCIPLQFFHYLTSYFGSLSLYNTLSSSLLLTGICFGSLWL